MDSIEFEDFRKQRLDKKIFPNFLEMVKEVHKPLLDRQYRQLDDFSFVDNIIMTIQAVSEHDLNIDQWSWVTEFFIGLFKTQTITEVEVLI